MPDITALFYIAIMAFYLLHKNEEAKILVPVIGFAAIPLFSNDYWQWFQLECGTECCGYSDRKRKQGIQAVVLFRHLLHFYRRFIS
ncbi:hypothetical protein P4S68_11515 [Pseudoalteromonas sp. Hal099]